MNLDDLARLLGLIPTLEGKIDHLTATVEKLVQASPPQFLSVAEFAQRNGICQATVRRQAKAGALVCRWVGRRCLISASALRPADPATVARLAREART